MGVHTQGVAQLMGKDCLVEEPSTGIPDLENSNTAKPISVTDTVLFRGSVGLTGLASSVGDEENPEIHRVSVLQLLHCFL